MDKQNASCGTTMCPRDKDKCDGCVWDGFGERGTMDKATSKAVEKIQNHYGGGFCLCNPFVENGVCRECRDKPKIQSILESHAKTYHAKRMAAVMENLITALNEIPEFEMGVGRNLGVIESDRPWCDIARDAERVLKRFLQAEAEEGK